MTRGSGEREATEGRNEVGEWGSDGLISDP
jgi:hypothetical protein